MFTSSIARSEATKQSSWIAAVGSTSLAMTSQGRQRARAKTRAFTLVELIVVMVLLLIVASMVAPRMSSFFRGRALNHEARRMLSLINYGQSRAIAEGVPVILWIDPAKSSYGLEIQAGYTSGDQRAVEYEAEPTLSFEIPTTTTERLESESEDETLGLPENLPVIRFTPDGFIDEVSVTRIIIRLGDEAALELGPTTNRLRYEIRPVTSKL
jgi:prepilin-type N-terminal cleavage/methylation domain-containing protein